MSKKNLDLIFYKASKWSGYILGFLVILFFVTGYGMTKGVMNRSLAAYLHNQVLPIPFFVLVLIHIIGFLRPRFKNYFKSNLIADLYIIVVSLLLLGACLYLYFL